MLIDLSAIPVERAITLGTSSIAALAAVVGTFRVHKLKLEVNHRLTELLKLTEKAAIAVGNIQGREELLKEQAGATERT